MADFVKVDVSDPDLFKPPIFPVISDGRHTFMVANDLKVKSANPPSLNSIIKVELRCQDEDKNKGVPVYDNFVLIANPETEKQRKGRKIQQARLSQFTVACGICSQKELEDSGEIPLTEFKGSVCEAITKQVRDNYNSDKQGIEVMKAQVTRYLFEDEKAEAKDDDEKPNDDGDVPF